ncbi:Ribose import ATP-binding protein RbsA [compost metagenome]
MLDEPTATLDSEGVKKLSNLIRALTSKGTAIMYVSHRLGEILELADRVTILRDGVFKGTYPVNPDLSESDLVSLMVGRAIEGIETRKNAVFERPVLTVKNLSGEQFHDINFNANVGEILGIAGAEGNGQREMMRALAGIEYSQGEVYCQDVQVNKASPLKALEQGVLYLSSDRREEAIFPELSVRKNMVATVLKKFSRYGFVSTNSEQASALGMQAEFKIKAANLDVPIMGLSGGNQQKAVLARSFRSGAKAILIDDPTQGVDAGARFEIYETIRKNIAADGTCIINSSDAQELSTICDRVLVFSRGRIVKELSGDSLTKENIVSSFLTVRDAERNRRIDAGGNIPGLVSKLIGGSNTWWMPIILLVALILLVGGYAASSTPVFFKALNVQHTLLALAPAALVAMAQLNVLLVRGIDVSVGAMMSLTVVLASYSLTPGYGNAMLLFGLLICLGTGVCIGLANGLVIRSGKVNAVIATIAMLSIVQGVALIARPTPGGLINPDLISLLKGKVGAIPYSTVLVVFIAVVGDFLLHRTRMGLEAKATGFNEESARRNGVSVTFVHMRAYVLASTMAVLAGLFLGAQVAVGHPTVGQNFALTAIAAAVLGGASLIGGRGSYTGAALGALFFTAILNVISLLGFSSAVAVAASGVMTLAAVLIYSLLGQAKGFAKGFGYKAFTPQSREE